MENSELDLLATWGREFIQSVAGVADACGQDTFEVVVLALGRPPDLATFRDMTDAQLARLGHAARDVLENPLIEDSRIRAAIDSTLRHYTE